MCSLIATKRTFPTTITGTDVEAGPVEFNSVGTCDFDVSVRDNTTTYKWTISLKRDQYNNVRATGAVDIFGNQLAYVYDVNDELDVATPIGDSGGRVYHLVFPVVQPSNKPTIEKTAGGGLSSDITVEVSDLYVSRS